MTDELGVPDPFSADRFANENPHVLNLARQLHGPYTVHGMERQVRMARVLAAVQQVEWRPSIDAASASAALGVHSKYAMPSNKRRSSDRRRYV